MRKAKANRCKCCNTPLGEIASHLIFDEAGKERNIAFLLFDYIGKKVSESDGGQQAVCDGCLRQLIQCYEFKQKCVQANDDSEDDDDDDDDDGSDSESNEDTKFNEIIEEEPERAENESEFDRFVEFIVESDEEPTDEVQMPTEIKIVPLNGAGEFKVAKTDESTGEEQRSPIAADVEYLDVEVDDDDNYAYVYMDTDESPEPESEIIELTEFALDPTSKPVKTIGELNFSSSRFRYRENEIDSHSSTDTDEDLHRIKEKLKQGVPRHMIELNRTMKATGQSLDVEKIVTSDDLINILEADYHNGNSYSRRVRDDADVFKMPNIEPCEEIEYLEEEDAQVSIDDYLKSIAFIDYVENYDSGFYCKVR